MKERMNYRQACPEALQAMHKLEGFVKNSGLDAQLCELIKIRASQINGGLHPHPLRRVRMLLTRFKMHNRAVQHFILDRMKHNVVAN